VGCQLQAPGASTSGAESSAVEMGTEKSEVYSTNMTQAMGAGKQNVCFCPVCAACSVRPC
jgi:hypothetical protein